MYVDAACESRMLSVWSMGITHPSPLFHCNTVMLFVGGIPCVHCKEEDLLLQASLWPKSGSEVHEINVSWLSVRALFLPIKER